MLLTKTISRNFEETQDIICNKCGGSLKSEYDYEGLAEYYFCGGYGSKIGDGVSGNFSLCETCLLELFKTFKHSPYDTENINHSDENEA